MVIEQSKTADLEQRLAQLDRPLADLVKLQRAGHETLPHSWRAALAPLGVAVPETATPDQAITAIWKQASRLVAAEPAHRADPEDA